MLIARCSWRNCCSCKIVPPNLTLNFALVVTVTKLMDMEETTPKKVDSQVILLELKMVREDRAQIHSAKNLHQALELIS
jgi:hypothetical protein